VPVIFYHRRPNSLVYYEQAANVPSATSITQRLSIVGPEPIPDAPAHGATAIQHNAWLRRCQDAGCTVKVKALAEKQE
jgi:hypothetical protein